jgi:hypothetical protein
MYTTSTTNNIEDIPLCRLASNHVIGRNNYINNPTTNPTNTTNNRHSSYAYLPVLYTYENSINNSNNEFLNINNNNLNIMNNNNNNNSNPNMTLAMPTPNSNTNPPKARNKLCICIEQGCKKKATYRFKKGPNNTDPSYCIKHKKEDMVVNNKQTCEHENCIKYASFNYLGNLAMFCKLHMLEGMEDVSHKRCLFEGCKVRPSFNDPGIAGGKYCVIHKTEGMEDRRHKSQICKHEGCKIRASFNIPGEDKPSFCNLHKVGGHNLNSNSHVKKLCEFKDCKKQPCYNFEEDLNDGGRFCNNHKLEGMKNVRNIFCEFEDCKTQASYNFSGLTLRRFCKAHRQNDMIDIKSNHCICQYNDCKKRALNKLPGDSKYIYCNFHKTNGMVETRSDLCK